MKKEGKRMKLTNSILSDDEKHLIHQRSLQILNDAGVMFKSKNALYILQQAGAKIDWTGSIAKIQPELVEEALKRTPGAFVLGARNPEYNFPMPSNQTGYFLDGTCTYTIDFDTGIKRYGTNKDVENSARVFQEADLGAAAWASVAASDKPVHSHNLHEFLTAMQNTSKHVQHELFIKEQTDYLISTLESILGSKEEIRKRKIASVVYCTISPLVHEAGMCDAYLALADYEVPVMPFPMPIPGLTAPASLFSAVCMNNAEVLSSIVLFQFSHPGTPIIYGAAEGSANFVSGKYTEKVESYIMSLASSEMGKFYGLPTCAQGRGGITGDFLPLTCGNVDLIDGIGTTEQAQTMMLEKIILENEAGHIAKRFHDGINSAFDFFEDILKVGPGGHFLKEKNTRIMSRNPEEFYVSKIITDEIMGSLDENERAYEKARERVREILNGPRKDEMPDPVNQEIEEILKRADKELEGLSE